MIKRIDKKKKRQIRLIQDLKNRLRQSFNKIDHVIFLLCTHF